MGTGASSGTSSTGTDPNFADSVDVERSVRFCKAFKLTPSSGPHILFLSSYPNLKKPAADHAFALGGMNPSQISALLSKITDELVVEGKMTPPAATEEVGTRAPQASAAGGSPKAAPTAAAKREAWWIRILEATQKSIRDSGCAWHVKVAAAGLEADLPPCEGPH